MAIRKRFIAGAKCPACQAQDSMAMWRENNIDIVAKDWDDYEISWNFKTHPFLYNAFEKIENCFK